MQPLRQVFLNFDQRPLDGTLKPLDRKSVV